MTWLLRLYPRRWRARYGDELAALVADERPSFGLFVDLLAGAVDARLNPQLTPAPTPQGGPPPMTTMQRLCARSRAEKYNGPLMIGSSLFFVGIGLMLHLAGEDRHLERWPRPVRWVVLGATLAAMFGFFLAVTLAAARL